MQRGLYEWLRNEIMAINQPRTFREYIWILGSAEGLFYVMCVGKCELMSDLRARLDPFVRRAIFKLRHRQRQAVKLCATLLAARNGGRLFGSKAFAKQHPIQSLQQPEPKPQAQLEIPSNLQ